MIYEFICSFAYFSHLWQRAFSMLVQLSSVQDYLKNLDDIRNFVPLNDQRCVQWSCHVFEAKILSIDSATPRWHCAPRSQAQAMLRHGKHTMQCTSRSVKQYLITMPLLDAHCEMKKSWEVMRGQREVMGCQWGGLGGQWEVKGGHGWSRGVVEGRWEVIAIAMVIR